MTTRPGRAGSADAAPGTDARSAGPPRGPDARPADAPAPLAVLFGPHNRATTAGVLLLISMVAFESMGVGTAMPALVADLGALSHYAWPFVAFMAAGVFGTVIGGRRCDLAGPGPVLLAGPVLFAAGLVTAGSAGGMTQLLAGRVLQGLGSGATTVGIYVLVGLWYPERVRPAMFGLMSSAWVLPALVGPPVSGLVTERWSWRWVFFGLVPVALLALALVVPAVRGLSRSSTVDVVSRIADPSAGGPREPSPTAAGPRESSPTASGPQARRPAGTADGGTADGGTVEPRPAVARRPGLVAAASGAAVAVGGLTYAGQQPNAVGATVALLSVVVLVPALRRLLPAGVARGRRGVPSVVACRGLCAALFFTATSYLPLILTSTHHWSLTQAGIPLVVGSLGWSAASAWQGRHPRLARPRLIRAGFTLLTAAVLGLLAVVPSWGIAWLSIPLWVLGGIGMGLTFPSVAFLLLRQSGPGELGFHTSAAQMSDQLGTATMIGAGGALLAALGTPTTSMAILVALLAALGVAGFLAAPRTVPADSPAP